MANASGQNSLNDTSLPRGICDLLCYIPAWGKASLSAVKEVTWALPLALSGLQLSTGLPQGDIMGLKPTINDATLLHTTVE